MFREQIRRWKKPKHFTVRELQRLIIWFVIFSWIIINYSQTGLFVQEGDNNCPIAMAECLSTDYEKLATGWVNIAKLGTVLQNIENVICNLLWL